MRVQFMDEAPRIGQGWRIVDVAVGRKWVRVWDCLGNRAKFTKAQWEKIADNASELPPMKKKRRKRSTFIVKGFHAEKPKRKSGKLAKPEQLELQGMLNKLFS
jgi:hypothetical protein